MYIYIYIYLSIRLSAGLELHERRDGDGDASPLLLSMLPVDRQRARPSLEADRLLIITKTTQKPHFDKDRCHQGLIESALASKLTAFTSVQPARRAISGHFQMSVAPVFTSSQFRCTVRRIEGRTSSPSGSLSRSVIQDEFSCCCMGSHLLLTWKQYAETPGPQRDNDEHQFRIIDRGLQGLCVAFLIFGPASRGPPLRRPLGAAEGRGEQPRDVTNESRRRIFFLQVSRADFNPTLVESQSKAAKFICNWLRALAAYDEVASGCPCVKEAVRVRSPGSQERVSKQLLLGLRLSDFLHCFTHRHLQELKAHGADHRSRKRTCSLPKTEKQAAVLAAPAGLPVQCGLARASQPDGV